MTPQTKRLQKVLLIGAVLTIIVTLLRRAVYVFYPNVLPSQHWHPPSLLMVRLGALLQGVSVGLMVVGVLSSTFSYILLIPRFRSLNARMIVIEGGAVALAWILLILSAGPV
jgi:hypothetical protein